MWHGWRPTSIASGILNHNTPTSETDRQDRQRDRQWSDRIGETVLQTVAQKLFAVCYQTVVCLSCLSVMLTYCGQMIGWIRMPLGMEVGLGSGHIMLDRHPAAPQKGPSSPIPSIFGLCLLWPNGWMDQEVTWYGHRPRPRPQC